MDGRASGLKTGGGEIIEVATADVSQQEVNSDGKQIRGCFSLTKGSSEGDWGYEVRGDASGQE